MQCPFCGQDRDKVVDSRSAEGGLAIRRRRQCLACGKRFTTYERVEEAIRLRVLKKDGSRVPYDRRRIIEGLQKACYKRPVGDDQIRKIVEATEEDIFRRFEKDVPSSFIGDSVAKRLQSVDKIAYVRFASVYRRFADVGELIDEARRVEEEPEPAPGQRDLFDQTSRPGQAAKPDGPD
ncbi:MAG TPA: transcriptional regulator NrdR [Phycisphaerae bacterium]|nr:transcriptional regulator NrdR [Phycisphaerae bacterium]